MDTRALTRERLRIDDLLLDPGRHELTRDGAIIELPRLSYQLLLALAEAAPNVVTQDELMERVKGLRIVARRSGRYRPMQERAASKSAVIFQTLLLLHSHCAPGALNSRKASASACRRPPGNS